MLVKNTVETTYTLYEVNPYVEEENIVPLHSFTPPPPCNNVGDRFGILSKVCNSILSHYYAALLRWLPLLSPAAAMAIYFTSSRDSLVTTMMRAFSVYFDRFVNIFDDFYEYLRDAMFTGSTCQLGSKFMQVNFEVFLASYLTSDYSTESDSRNLVQSRAYRRCFYDYFVELYALELSYSFGHFSRIINQTMRYMRALYVSDHIMETVLSQDLTTSCRNAMLKMTHCAQCASYSSPDTCGRLCLNTMRGCLVELSDLAEPFRQFAEAVVRMKNMVEPIIDQLTLLQADFFQVISFAEIQAPTIVNEVSHKPVEFVCY